MAQEPLPDRAAARLLLVPRDPAVGTLSHSTIRELPQKLRAGDLLVVNDAKVVPARLRGRKRGSGGKIELLLVEPLADAGPLDWLALGQAGEPLRARAQPEVGRPGFEGLADPGSGEPGPAPPPPPRRGAPWAAPRHQPPL